MGGLNEETVLSIWAEKAAIYRQGPDEGLHILDHMFLIETAVASHRAEYEAEIQSQNGATLAKFQSGGRLSFVNDWLLDRQARSFSSLKELDETIPNGQYRCAIRDSAGERHVDLALVEPTQLPAAPTVTFRQHGQPTLSPDSRLDIEMSWTPFEPSSVGTIESQLFPYSTIFVLIDNCRGETVFSSGSGARQPSLSSDVCSITIPAGTFEPGLHYTAFLSFIDYRSAAAAGATEAVCVNSVMVEVSFEIAGEPADGRSCPPIPVRACYRWPGKMASAANLLSWPVAACGLTLEPITELRSPPL